MLFTVLMMWCLKDMLDMSSLPFPQKLTSWLQDPVDVVHTPSPLRDSPDGEKGRW